jgi:hypothetical protein
MSFSAGSACALTLMRRRTSRGKPLARKRGACAAPAREEAAFFAFFAGFGRAAGCFTGEGRGCGKSEGDLVSELWHRPQ